MFSTSIQLIREKKSECVCVGSSLSILFCLRAVGVVVTNKERKRERRAMTSTRNVVIGLMLAAAMVCVPAVVEAALDGEVYDATDSVGENQLGLDVRQDSVVYNIIGAMAPMSEEELEESLSNFNIECTPTSETLRFSVNYLAGGTIGYYVVEGCEGMSVFIVCVITHTPLSHTYMYVCRYTHTHREREREIVPYRCRVCVSM